MLNYVCVNLWFMCTELCTKYTMCIYYMYNSVRHYLFISSLLITLPYGSKDIPCLWSESTFSTLNKTAQPQHVPRSDEDYQMCTFVLIFSKNEKRKPSHIRKINISGTIYMIWQVRYDDFHFMQLVWLFLSHTYACLEVFRLDILQVIQIFGCAFLRIMYLFLT